VDRAYNSFVVLDDGTVVTKDLSRGPEPSTFSVLDASTLEDRAVPVSLGEPSVARLSADGLVVYAQGTETALRFVWDPDRGVLTAETGAERARAATGSPVPSVVFPAVDHAGALWYCSFTTLARVTPRGSPSAEGLRDPTGST